MNLPIFSSNRSGIKGVSWNAHCRKWCAEVQKDNRKVYREHFTNIAEAEAAVIAARQKYHGAFARST